jgi:hypothetical protein
MILGSGQGGEQNRPKRIPDVVADDGEDPLFEVARQRELLLAVLALSVLRFSSLVDVYRAADESREASGAIQKGNAAIKYPAVHPVVAPETMIPSRTIRGS